MHLQIRVIELVLVAPTQGPELLALLNDGMEEAQAVHQLVVRLGLAALRKRPRVGLHHPKDLELVVAPEHVRAQPCTGKGREASGGRPTMHPMREYRGPGVARRCAVGHRGLLGSVPLPTKCCWRAPFGGGGVGTRPWGLALLACGRAYWPLALEPSAMTSRRPYCCGHPYYCGHPPAGGRGGIQNATSAHGVLP